MSFQKFPLAIFRVPGPLLLDGVQCEFRTVAGEDELSAAQAEGWHDSIPGAVAASKPAEPTDDAPITRAELEQKATELGLKFDGRTGDKRLAALIAEALG